MTEQDLFPENIAVGLTRFGSILAILRLLIFMMNWINQRQFERKVTRFLQREKGEGPQESSASEDSSLYGDTYRRKTLHIQDEEINGNDYLLNVSTPLSQLGGEPNAEKGEIKKRYSIEMFEELIQTVVIQRQEVSHLRTLVTD